MAIHPGKEPLDALSVGSVGLSFLYNGCIMEDEVDEDKEKKPNCSPGNPYHDKETGKWTSKEKAGSYSLSEPVKGRNCTSGQSKMPGRKIVKKDNDVKPRARCGRVDAKNPDKKTKWKCSGGEALWEIGYIDGEECFIIPIETLRDMVVQQQSDILEGNNKAVQFCKDRGMYSLQFFLNMMNNLAKSKDGNLIEPYK